MTPLSELPRRSVLRSEIAPGGFASLPRSGGVSVPQQATAGAAHVTFVVLEDDTALGDEREIAFVFEQRRNHQAFWHEMDAIVKDVTAGESDPTAAFALLRGRMEAEQDPAFRRGGGGWYGEILARMTERRMTLAQTTPQYVLESLRSTITEEKALCDTHLQRRR